jgi:hypothetical protein
MAPLQPLNSIPLRAAVLGFTDIRAMAAGILAHRHPGASASQSRPPGQAITHPAAA